MEAESGLLSDEDWHKIDHSCLATATNGQIFRDDLGLFTNFRNLLLDYYPEKVWKMRIAEQLHIFSSALQVNYSRCMTRGDFVTAGICRTKGLEAAMELFFLFKKAYMPYYKWSFRALSDIDSDGTFQKMVSELSSAQIDISAWENYEYDTTSINTADNVLVITEQIAAYLLKMLRETHFTRGDDLYLERYVDDVLWGI